MAQIIQALPTPVAKFSGLSHCSIRLTTKAATMKKLRRWAIRLIIAIPLIIGAAWLIENYRGYQEWEEAQERAAKLGVSLDLADYAGPTIPDSQNLLKNSYFSREWHGEIEPNLKRWGNMDLDVPKPRGIRHQRGKLMDFLQYFPDESDPKIAIEKLSEATKEIESRLYRLSEIILSYPPQDLSSRPQILKDLDTPVNEILLIKQLTESFKDQAIIALHRDNPRLAIHNCKAIDRLAANFELPDFVHILVTNALRQTIHRISNEGILLQAWNADHLNTLSKLTITEVDRMPLANAFSYEAAFSPLFLKDTEMMFDNAQVVITNLLGGEEPEPPSIKEKIQRWIAFDGPKGWEQRRQAFVLNANLDQIESSNKWKWNKLESSVIDLDELENEGEEISFDPLLFVRGVSETYAYLPNAIFEQALRSRLGLLAIEVEKYRIATGDYPKSLDELPKGLPITDPCAPKDRALHYELLPEGGFQIYPLSFYEDEPDPRRNKFIWQFPTRK
ncbi:hypothetical protein N9A94_03515 [Akkermansiaceae bacterium]|nr:hypothetical protein [Akkermansiaceae bacterium]MDB4537888.1 hypothetical protein [Akkermansiaceae bacterium]